MNEIDVKQLDEQALFAQALEVINRSLDRNKDKTPYKQMIAASEKLVGGKPIAVSLTKGGGEPYDFYTVEFSKGRFSLEGRGKSDDANLRWTVSRDYLEGIVSDPEPYVEHPEKLDLDWLKDKIGF